MSSTLTKHCDLRDYRLFSEINSRLRDLQLVNFRMILSQILKIEPMAPKELAEELSFIWDEVLSSVIKEMLNHAKPNIGELHVNLREEMALEMARLMSFISERIVSDRMSGRLISEINPTIEREQCFSEAGRNKISNTAVNCAEHIWIKKYNERWKPKSEAALKKEEVKRKTKVIAKKVEENHFIPKSFIKRYWSEGQFVYKSIKTSSGVENKNRIPLGSWGFRINLYSDYLEAYFGLVEGDAVKPIEMVLKVEPLNYPQREALIGFIVIQRIRNPHFMESLAKSMAPVVANEVGEDKAKDRTYMKRVYETLYSQNEFYDQLARPILFSRWVVVRSETPDFLLPDACNLFGSHKGQQYVFMPLTPRDCLIVLPIPVDEPRIVPHYIKATESMVKDISYILYRAARNEFLSASAASLHLNDEEPDTVMQRIILTLAKITDTR